MVSSDTNQWACRMQTTSNGKPFRNIENTTEILSTPEAYGKANAAHISQTKRIPANDGGHLELGTQNSEPSCLQMGPYQRLWAHTLGISVCIYLGLLRFRRVAYFMEVFTQINWLPGFGSICRVGSKELSNRKDDSMVGIYSLEWLTPMISLNVLGTCRNQTTHR